MKYLIFVRTVLVLPVMLMLLTSCLKAKPSTPYQSVNSQDANTTIIVDDEYTAPPLNLASYEYRYDEGRERDWEHDIIYLAKQAVYKHPKLTGGIFRTYVAEDYNLSGGLDQAVYSREFTDMVYDEDLLNAFLKEVDRIVSEIPNLSDDEISFEIVKLIALLDDAHSWAELPQKGVFPLSFEAFYTDSGIEVRLVSAPAEREDLLFSKLVKINETPVDEVLDRLFEYVSAENDYLNLRTAVRPVDPWLSNALLLKSAGISERDSITADYTFELDNGEEITYTATETTKEGLAEIEIINKAFYNTDALMYKNKQLRYWYEYLPEDNIVYIKINSVVEREDLPWSELFKQILETEAAAEGAQKIVFDFRDNGGGFFTDFGPLIDELNGRETDGVYIVVAGNSVSAAVTIPYTLKKRIDGAILIGEPAGQPVNYFPFWDARYTPSLPTHGNSFRIADQYLVQDIDYPYDALMPDITVYQTVEDYKNGVDTVMEEIRGRK